MPAVPAISRLPTEIIAWLDQALCARGFGDYAAITSELNERLRSVHLSTLPPHERARVEMGEPSPAAASPTISMSAVGRYGLGLKAKVERIRAATAAAQAIAAAAPDDEGQQSAAVTSLLSTEMFERLMELGESAEETDPGERIDLIARAARAHADLTRASISQKKWAGEVRRQALAEAAERVQTAAQARGLSAEDAQFWRQQVLMGM